ncbi:Hypothetical Protein FCC1311_038612 [Hondaea fermentalgiana]|uniref:Uncharacterized protein n=1 Tax=Hondaea fermentalgiana TaxID=2315210 RepID=A0A2R5GD38_9STRA|nr:Hypothetical Protein FCC1311_038612 [Hondaea fermentalgiana]|eukprot:GBG27638.1 Hypothetical Protein FCC1311_038612 [Hondaea fermentalgiana]
MDALQKVRIRTKDPITGEENVKELRKVPTDSHVTAERLVNIVGDAVWKWARAQNDHAQKPRGILERAWEQIDRISVNTSGCKMWKNANKPGFPYRPLCYSQTTQTCTLGNTPNKISRLELHEGLREVLGLKFAWCHVDMLIRTMNQRAMPTGKNASIQSIARETFIGALWPRVSKLAFDHCLEFGNVNAHTIQSVLTLQDEREECDSRTKRDFHVEFESKWGEDADVLNDLESKTSIIYASDL